MKVLGRAAPPEDSTRRKTMELHLLRYVPGSSPVHRTWAGTKLVAVTAFGLTLSLKASWAAEAVLAVALVGTWLLARIPIGAIPRFPRWILWLVLGLSAVPALLSGGRPYLNLGGAAIGLGSLGLWARFLVFTALLLLATYLVGWTTPLPELAPALARLLSPLRRLRLPVDEVVIAIGLSIRCLPLLVDELRILYAARRVRRTKTPASLMELVREAVDILVSALVVATRRAGEMGDAIQARGGVGPPALTGARPGRLDLAALAVVGVVTAAMAVA